MGSGSMDIIKPKVLVKEQNEDVVFIDDIEGVKVKIVQDDETGKYAWVIIDGGRTEGNFDNVEEAKLDVGDWIRTNLLNQ